MYFDYWQKLQVLDCEFRFQNTWPSHHKVHAPVRRDSCGLELSALVSEMGESRNGSGSSPSTRTHD